jgi:hypothetical protein
LRTGELSDFCSSGNHLAPYLFAQASGWTPEQMLAQIDEQRAHAFDNPAAAVPAFHEIGGSVREIRVTNCHLRQSRSAPFQG